MKFSSLVKMSLFLCGFLAIGMRASEARQGAVYIPDRIPDRVSKRIPDRIPDAIPDVIPDATPRPKQAKLTYSKQMLADRAPSSSTHTCGVGLSTLNVMPFTSIGGFASATSITGITSLTNVDLIQAFFSIPQTSPFNIGAMGLYKRIIMESQNAGLHVGGGLGLASVNTGIEGSFALSLTAIGGIHFRLPGIPQLEAHLDGGPTFYSVTTSPRTTNNFLVSALSPALGLSVLYLF